MHKDSGECDETTTDVKEDTTTPPTPHSPVRPCLRKPAVPAHATAPVIPDSRSTQRSSRPEQLPLQPPVPAQGDQDFDSRDVRTWNRGIDVPLSAALSILTDKQLGRGLSHHKMLLSVPEDWWRNPDTGQLTACTIMVNECVKISARGHYLNCTILKPDAAMKQGQLLQLLISDCKGQTPA